MLRNMASSLFISDNKRIITTLAKAKALRKYVEPLITKAKTNTTHSRRQAFVYLQNKEAVTELFGDIAAKVSDRPGGYTRVLKLGPRQGDNAEMALIELVDFNEYTAAEPTKKKSRRRRTSSPKPKAKTAAPAVEETPAVEEAPVVEETPEAEVEETPVAEADEEDKPVAEDDAAGEEE